MQTEQQKKVVGAFQLVLRPVVKILLRYSIGFSEFVEAVKTTYVDVASSEFGIRRRPTNISRVAVMTGLTRKEVRRIRTKIENGQDAPNVKTTPLAEIIHRWHSEHDYIDSHGRPIPLPFSGSDKSFSALVKQFGGDVPPGAMRTELKRVGSIEEADDGLLHVRNRTLVPDDVTERLYTSLVHAVYPLLSTICATYSSEESTDENFPTVFSAFSANTRIRIVARLRRICADRLRSHSESFDDLCSLVTRTEFYENSLVQIAKEKPVAIGLFYFEEHDENARYEVVDSSAQLS